MVPALHTIAPFILVEKGKGGRRRGMIDSSASRYKILFS